MASHVIMYAQGATYAAALQDKRSAGSARAWMNRMQMAALVPVDEPVPMSEKTFEIRMAMAGIEFVKLDKEGNPSQT